jgi:predicted esterase
MRLRINRFIFILGLIASQTGRLTAAIEAEVTPTTADNFYEARARLFLPSSAAPLRGVLIFVGGTDCDWRYQADALEWRSFADKTHLALVGTYFRGDGESYDHTDGGSGAALLRMVKDLGDLSGKPELARLPLFFIGHSAGAMFSYSFICWKPERCAAFFSSKSGPISPTKNTKAFEVPALFVVGENDDVRRIESVVKTIDARNDGARWTIAIEPGAGHGFTENEHKLAQAYIAAVLECNNSSSRYSTLENPTASTTQPAGQGTNVWLPTPDFSEQWQRFTKSTSLEKLMETAAQNSRNAVAVSPTAIDFGDIAAGEKSSSRVQRTVIVETQGFDLQKSYLHTDSQGLSAVLRPGKDANKSRLEVTIDTANLPAEHYQGLIRILPMGRTMSDSPPEIRVAAHILSDIEAAPASMYLGVIPCQKIVERKIGLRSKDGRPLEVVKASFSRDFGHLASQVKTKGGATLLLQFGGRSTGNQSGYCDLYFNEAVKPLRITFIAWVTKEAAVGSRVASERNPENLPTSSTDN